MIIVTEEGEKRLCRRCQKARVAAFSHAPQWKSHRLELQHDFLLCRDTQDEAPLPATVREERWTEAEEEQK